MSPPADPALLNRLVVRCNDDGRTYRAAAAACALGARRDELLALARRRSSHAVALATLVRSAGMASSRYGSMTGWLRLRFFGLRVVVLGRVRLGDSLDACMRQQSGSVDAYRHALERDWAEEIGAVLRAQLDEMTDALARVAALQRKP